MSLATWIRGRKTAAAATALAVLIAAPVTVAVLHDGFPVSNLDLKALDVWVTSASDQLAARFNTQIKDLDSQGVPPSTKAFDVLQNGNNVFLTQGDGAKVSRINAATSLVSESITASSSFHEEFGGGRLAVLSATGQLWILDGTTALSFSPKSKPIATFGAGSAVAVGTDGTIAVAAGKDRRLYVIPAGSVARRTQGASLSGSGALAVTLVGDHAVALAGQHSLLWDDGSQVPVGAAILHLQQPGPAADTVVVATNNALLQVAHDKVASTVDAAPASTGDSSADPRGVAAPVNLDGCIHGAWTSSWKYVAVCQGQKFEHALQHQASAKHELTFRVNQDVIALNDTQSGDVWLVTRGSVVNANVNWTKVKPPDEKNATVSTDKTSVPTFAPQPPQDKGLTNHNPVAHPDELGARPGGSAILNVLANDTDEDGDVLRIDTIDAPPAGEGTLTRIDGGRALQYSAPPGSTAAFSFTSQYTISDGRGGTGASTVTVTVDGSTDQPPSLLHPTTPSAVVVEPGQTVTYNVLADWYDPNGDDLILEDAQAPTGAVSFSPDGLITYTASTQVGSSVLAIKVGETAPGGRKPPLPVAGTLYVDVKAAGSLSPITQPDFATATVGQPTKVLPLANDLSPSGVPLTLGEVKPALGPANGVTFTTNPSDNSITLTGTGVGQYYLSYRAAAGDKSQQDYLRFDVVSPASKDDGPTAVRDVAYLRPGEPVTVPVLDNDLSPSGAVLGVVSVENIDPGSGLSVQVLTGAVIKVTAPSGLTTPTEFDYTISDGAKTSVARVSVVPLPKVTNPQQPITKDDSVTVRVGSTVSVNVLANDYSPDGSQMHLSPNLTNVQVGGGFAFVSGDRVRLQAPSKAGNGYSLTYTVTDDNGQSNTGRVTYLVTDDAKNNKPPIPPVLTARVFTGGTLKIQVPLDGIDPDGDPVTLVGVAGASLGTVTSQNASSFAYVAPPVGSPGGTDTFTYEVKDQLAPPVQGIVKIAVLPAPSTSLAPSAVSDFVAIRPDQVSTVPVLLNDSDPNGYTIRFDPKKKLITEKPLIAQLKGGAIVVTAPHKVGDYQVHYFIDNKHNARADAYLTVHVNPNAPAHAPVAFDQTVDPTTVVGKHTVKVDVLHDAQNLDGLVSDLAVTSVGRNSTLAKPNKDGTLTVTLGSQPEVIAYQLENHDKLKATAVITVPAFLDNLPPYLKAGYILKAKAGETTTVDIRSFLISHGEPKIVDPAAATSPEQKAKTPLATSATQLSFTPKAGFSGKTYLTFVVSGTGLANDPNAVTIQVPVLVTDPNHLTVPPTFANQTFEVEVGAPAVQFDLRGATSHPDPQVLKAVTYQVDPAPSGHVHYSFDNGDKLTISVDRVSPLPSPLTVIIKMESGGVESQGKLTIKPVPTKAPPPQAVDDTKNDASPNTPVSVPVLGNDFDPFAGQPGGSGLTLVSVASQGDILGASYQKVGNNVQVTPGSAKSGTLSFVYTMQDYLKRQATGRLTVIVTSAPEPVTNFTLSNPTSQRVSVDFSPPVSNNGEPITGYVVRIADSGGPTQRTDCTAGVTCVFDNRTNGVLQTVDISATNSRGTTWSATQTITPYGTPSVPVNPVVNSNSSTATATIQPVWGAPTDAGGGNVHYDWNYTSQGTQTTTATNGPTSDVGAGDYAFQVRACNPGGCSAYVSSANRHINPPPQAVVISKGTQATSASCTSSACYQIAVSASGFAANTTYTVTLETDHYADGSHGAIAPYGTATITTDSSGAFNGGISPYGYPGYKVQIVINGTPSNIVNW